MPVTIRVPVFYDIEASSLEGFPIEIGWAHADPAWGNILSEGHLIRPPAYWDVRATWDPSVACRHRIVIDELRRFGRPVWDIARRMNETLRGSELFADSPFDEAWLRQLFDAAGIEPDFSVRRTHPVTLLAGLGCDQAIYAVAKQRALRVAPLLHRAEADAWHWAILWAMISRSVSDRRSASSQV